VSIDLNALATWSYDTGTLTYIPNGSSVVIDISANPALHLILSAPHWKNLGSKTVYSSDPADWKERKIKWNRAGEDPPVLQIEQHIGEADFVDYTVYKLEDSETLSELAAEMTAQFNTLRTRAYTKADTVALMKNFILGLQKLGLIAGD
jgi:hypothetical protein